MTAAVATAPARTPHHAGEVERILTAAVRVMARTAPDPPKVSDIIAEAGSCNKAFYRYFGSKDDLVLAVMERGIGVVAASLREQMDAETHPVDRVGRWVRGLLEQVADPHLFSMCHATVAQMSAIKHRRATEDEMMEPLRTLLIDALEQLGRNAPERDADAVFNCTMGTLRRYVGSDRRPPPEDVEHLVRFCLSGIGVGTGDTARP